SVRRPFALDLHVLGLPPAFNLSHDQTLQFKNFQNFFSLTPQLAPRSKGLLEIPNSGSARYELTTHIMNIQVTCSDRFFVSNPSRKRPHALLDLFVKQPVKGFASTVGCALYASMNAWQLKKLKLEVLIHDDVSS